MATIYQLRIGDRVSGTYYGVPFTGRIRDLRAHSQNDQRIFYVDFDRPLDIPMIQVQGRTFGTITVPSKNATIEASESNPALSRTQQLAIYAGMGFAARRMVDIVYGDTSAESLRQDIAQIEHQQVPADLIAKSAVSVALPIAVGVAQHDLGAGVALWAGGLLGAWFAAWHQGWTAGKSAIYSGRLPSDACECP